MDRHDDLVVAPTPLIDVLDRLNVAWYVGGSVASTVHGRGDTEGHMSDDAAVWIRDFLRCRALEFPDGRALYAYRCTGQEFAALTETLERSVPLGNQPGNAVVRSFVLYASEWWQRRYDGRQWAWEPLLASIGWYSVDYPDLYEPVRNAWRWWNVDLVRLPTSTRYLGTFACQGGLPLALVGDTGSRVTQYLRAVLNHAAAYRQFIDDPIDLARDQQHLLNPPTLRRDYVFRLAADLIEAVLDLQNDIESDSQDADPLNALDQARPDWRRTMPLALEDARARGLLTGLLREAAQSRSSPSDDFRVERFLRRTDVGWRLGARIRLPASVSAVQLAHQLRVPAAALPPRLEMRLQGERVRVVGLYVRQSDDFRLARNARNATELWDSEACGEIRLRCLAGGEVGEPVVPQRGSALGGLPWTFRSGDDGAFIGEGSVSNRAPEIVVLVPDGCTPEHLNPTAESSPEPVAALADGFEDQVHVLNRTLWRISESIAIDTGSGRCVIRPSSVHAVEEEYRLSGKRFHDLESTSALFRDAPILRVARTGQTPRAVPAGEVSWRQTGGNWRSRPHTPGLWEVRHLREGELRHLGRTGILPARFELTIEPGTDMGQGHLILTQAQGVRVAGVGQDAEAVVTARTEGDNARVHVATRNEAAPPAHVKLRLHWSGGSALTVQAPFPGQGGRFLREGRTLDRDLAVDDLYGVRAVALSPDPNETFRIEGELKAPELGGLLRVAHFRRSLGKSGVKHELALIDVRPMIDLMLAASSSSEASVDLRIVDRSQREHGATRVHRFATALEHDPDMAFFSLSPTHQEEVPTTFEALRIARPSLEPIPLDVIGPAAAPHGAVLPRDLDLEATRLLVVARNDRVRIRPIAIGGKPSPSDIVDGVRDTEVPRLHEAMNLVDPDSRESAIAEAMDELLEHEDKRGEEEWAFLTDSLLCMEDLPASVSDLFKVLATKPMLLVRCLFRLESAPRNRLWRLEEELPFSWLLIRRDIWWAEAKRVFERILKQLSGVFDGDREQLARGHVTSILDEGEERIPALSTVSTDVALRLAGARLNDTFAEAVAEERDRKTTELINLRASLDDWPKGDGRSEWVQELERGEALDRMWQHPNEHRARQPIFDTPVAAAWCCFVARPTERATFLVKRIRAHDPEWFDVAYSAAWFRLARKMDDFLQARR